MDERETTITREHLNHELARSQVEQVRLHSSVRILQAMVGVLLVVCLVLAVGMWRLSSQVLSTTGEVNGLRSTIQDMFSDNLPAVTELQETLAKANAEAVKVNASMADTDQFGERVDEAIAKANEEMPKTMERFFQDRGPELIAEAVASPEVTEAGKEQSTKAMLQALDEPAIENKMNEKIAAGLEEALKGMTLGSSSSSKKE
jgi:cell division protein FtsL